MKKNVLLGVLLAILLIVVGVYYLNIKPVDDPLHPMEELSQRPGAIAYGVYSGDRLLDNGSYINDTSINHTFEISQNMRATRIYKLILLVDFKQHEFTVNGENYLSYDIELVKKDEARIVIETELPKSTKEICYLVVKKPYYENREGDLEKAHILQEVLPIRYRLDLSQTAIDYNTNVTRSRKGPIPDIFLTRNLAKLKPIFTLREGANNYLLHGNTTSGHMSYATIQLVDWKQTSWNEDSMVKYFEVNKNEIVIMETKAPEVSGDAIIQYITFPYPYDVSPDNIFSTMAFATFRSNILKKK